MFAPNLFGNPAHGDFWGYANFWEDAIYIGLLPVLLALSVLLRPGRWPNLPSPADVNDWADRPLRILAERRALVGFLWLILIAGFGLALGKNTPLFPWLYRNVPTFSMFQAPARFLIWIEISLVILAAMGADRWRRPEKRALYWTRLATAGGFAVTLGAGMAWYLMSQARTLPEIALSAIGATALAGLWGLLAGGLSLLAPKADTRIVGSLQDAWTAHLGLECGLSGGSGPVCGRFGLKSRGGPQFLSPITGQLVPGSWAVERRPVIYI